LLTSDLLIWGSCSGRRGGRQASAPSDPHGVIMSKHSLSAGCTESHDALVAGTSLSAHLGGDQPSEHLLHLLWQRGSCASRHDSISRPSPSTGRAPEPQQDLTFRCRAQGRPIRRGRGSTVGERLFCHDTTATPPIPGPMHMCGITIRHPTVATPPAARFLGWCVGALTTPLVGGVCLKTKAPTGQG
jgi:hypothetical protein